jgi:flagellar L-ring protein precursor FlgH
MKIHNLLIVSTSLFLVTGCSQKQNVQIEEKPKMQIQKKVAQPVKNKGSLYSRKGASLFADKKDLQIGDIIKINISEKVENESSSTRDTSKSNSFKVDANPFTAPTAATEGSKKRVNNLNSTFGIGVGMSSSNSFGGSVETETDEEFTTSISAIIEDIYQNGNYFIKGEKQILINGQKQIVKVSGVIRPYDITPQNEIESNQIANLKVFYEKEGEGLDSLEKPWGSKVLETIWPF